jgi:nicotinamidase-related amidase
MAHDTALLVIDVQCGLFDEQYPEDKATLDAIAGLLERARAIGTPVLYLQHHGTQPGHPLQPGLPGWPIHPVVAPREGEAVIVKHASDSFYKTPLKETLEARGVRRLVVTGAQTEFCVDTTCRRALSEGYDVTLVADGHTTGDRATLTTAQLVAYHNETLPNLAHPDHTITVQPAAEVTF